MNEIIAGTAGANEFALDLENGIDDIQVNWWELLANYRLKKWRNELKKLRDERGLGFDEVMEYLGGSPNEDPNMILGFYKRMPGKRETFIGIGMAYKQPLEIINRWLIKYGAKRKLYVKDMINDLIWIYLINANCDDRISNTNYYHRFNECKSKVEEILDLDEWEKIEVEDADTVVLDEKLKNIDFEPGYAGLKKFVAENMGAFKTAYFKPRKYLKNHLNQILESLNKQRARKRVLTMNFLRGYLDDSMINYLSGTDGTMSVVEDEKGHKHLAIKYTPRNKRAHIAICLALGMLRNEINEYLEMMGYYPLDATNLDEGQLINLLGKWEMEHHLQKKYKDKFFEGKDDVILSEEDELTAVEEMLHMRRDLKDGFDRGQSEILENHDRGKARPFPYLKS